MSVVQTHMAFFLPHNERAKMEKQPHSLLQPMHITLLLLRNENANC